YHFSAALRVLRYLKNALGTGVQFDKGSSFGLHAFSDADWAKCPKTRKSSAESDYRCLALANNVADIFTKRLLWFICAGVIPAHLANSLGCFCIVFHCGRLSSLQGLK
ncbi:hypothetical protein Tco_1294350, partial [Tanacetum coccineum]